MDRPDFDCLHRSKDLSVLEDLRDLSISEDFSLSLSSDCLPLSEGDSLFDCTIVSGCDSLLEFEGSTVLQSEEFTVLQPSVVVLAGVASSGDLLSWG